MKQENLDREMGMVCGGCGDTHLGTGLCGSCRGERELVSRIERETYELGITTEEWWNRENDLV